MKKELISGIIVLFLTLSLAIISGISLTINSPQAVSYFTNTNVSFNVTASENGTCWYSINSGDNITISSEDNITFYAQNSTLPAGDYNITYYCNDTLGNLTQASSSFAVIVMNITLNSPSNNAYTTAQLQNFTCSALTYDADFVNITLKAWNSSGLMAEETQSLAGKNASASFLHNLTANSQHYWTCVAYNSNSATSTAGNYSITYDTGNPTTTLISPANDNDDYEEDSNVPFKYNVTDSFEINYCTLFIGDSAKKNDTSVSKNNEESITYSFSSSGSYEWKIRCYDKAGNHDDSGERTIDIQSADDEGGSSGGGSDDDEDYLDDIANYNSDDGEDENTNAVTTTAVSSNVVVINNSAILQGYTVQAKEGRIFSFEIEAEKIINITNSTTNITTISKIRVNETHKVTIEDITNNTGNLTIRSEPINLELKIGEEKKLNLTSSEYYDLYIKLNSINSSINEANITIREIKENTRKRGFFGSIINFLSLSYNKTKEFFSSYIVWVLIVLAVILALVIMGAVEYLILKKKMREGDVRPVRAEHQKHKS